MGDSVVISKFERYFITHSAYRVKFLFGTPNRGQGYLNRMTANRSGSLTEGDLELIIFRKRTYGRNSRPFERLKRVIFFAHGTGSILVA
jgi:hypothetical protein